MKKEMLINVMQPEECRIAIIEDGILQELYVERTSQESYVNNIYKGKVVNIEPSIQAAFVDFGIGRNGFLHVSDVASAYFRDRADRGDRGGRGDRRDDRGGRGRGRDRDPGRRPFEPVEIPSGSPRRPEPPEYADEPEPARARPQEDEDFGDFGAGIEVEETEMSGTVVTGRDSGVDVRDVEEDIADAARDEEARAEAGETSGEE